MRVEDNTNCIECGNAFELHSLDRRCPKNGGYQINGKLEFFATHFEPEISETDELRARIDTLTAERDNLARLLKEGAGLVNEYAAENDRLTAAHIESIEAMKASHKEDIETYKAEQAFLGMAISILKSDKEKQAAYIEWANAKIEALERVK